MAIEKQKNEWDKKELGALWKHEKKSLDGTTKGEAFLSGKINLKNYGFDKDIELVIFKNKNKEKDTHPDLKVYFSEPRVKPTTPARANVAKAAPTPAPEDDLI